MYLKYFCLLFFAYKLVQSSDVCCAKFYAEKKYVGNSITICNNCTESCINLQPEWRNKISSVDMVEYLLNGRERPTEWESAQDHYPQVAIYSEVDCKGENVLISKYSSHNCNGFDLTRTNVFIARPLVGRNCGEFNMDKRAVSVLIIPPVMPFTGYPASDFNPKIIFAKNAEPLEKILRSKIRNDESLEDICNTCKITLNVAGLIPYASDAAQVITIVADLFKQDHWRDDMLTAIPEAIYHESARSLGTQVKSRMDIVTDFTNQWQRNISDNQPTERIYAELLGVISLMNGNKDLFAKFPDFAVKPIFGICTSMTYFLPKMSHWKRSDGLLVPQYKELINFFRNRLIEARMNKLHGSKDCIDHVKNIPYNKNGYVHRETILYCLKDRNCTTHIGDEQCLLDEATPQGIYSHSSDVRQCFTTYAKLVRTRFEEAFYRLCDLTL